MRLDGANPIHRGREYPGEYPTNMGEYPGEYLAIHSEDQDHQTSKEICVRVQTIGVGSVQPMASNPVSENYVQ